MAREAERLLAGTRWVPEPLRTPDGQQVETETTNDGDGEDLPAFLADDGGDGETAADPEEPQPYAEAAE